MVADEQTHDAARRPGAAGKLRALLRLCRYGGVLARAHRATGDACRSHYAALFEDSPELTTGGANMVFAGEQDDPGTVAALKEMGFTQPSEVIATVRGWHHGRYPAVRTPRARERLTEVQPLLIEALAETADPDRAFAGFDRFLAELPSGVQLFSLLRANPGLLRLIAAIMGTAPRLARILSRRRRVLDAVLDPRLLGMLPTAEELDRLIAAEIGDGEHDIQEVLDRARVVGSEQPFLIGVRVLSGSHQGQPGGRRLRAAGRAADRCAASAPSSASWCAPTGRCRAAARPCSPWASSAAAR